ncbi:unnamed protein product, partial [Musa acuminata var. zebrina]
WSHWTLFLLLVKPLRGKGERMILFKETNTSFLSAWPPFFMLASQFSLVAMGVRNIRPGNLSSLTHVKVRAELRVLPDIVV